MALGNKFLSPTCAPDLEDIDTYFFFEKIFRSDIRICVTMTSFFGALMSPEIQKIPKDQLFSKKNSWRVLYYLAQLFTRGFDFVRRCGEVDDVIKPEIMMS